MSIAYGLKLACDSYFLMLVGGLLGFLNNLPMAMTAMPMLLAIGAGIGYRAGKRSEALHYLPLAIALPLLLTCGGKRDYIVAAVLAVYAVMYVKNNRRVTDYYYAFVRFLEGMVVVVLGLLMAVMAQDNRAVQMLPSVFLHVALSIVLLKMLRHDAKTISQRRFQLISLSELAIVFAVGGLLSTDIVLKAFRWAVDALYRYAVLPTLKAALWLLERILYGINWLLSLFQFEGGVVSAGEISAAGSMPLSDFGDLDETAERVAASPVAKYILIGLGIALLCVVAFIALRALSRQGNREDRGEHQEERESLDEDRKQDRGLGGMLRRRNDPVLGVRYVYQKYLKLAEAKGVELNGRQNSMQIRQLSAGKMSAEGLDALREVYIRARYDGNAAPQDVESAKQALAMIKKEP